MICTEAFPFVHEFVAAIDLEMRQINPNCGLSWIQRKWLAFCVVGTWVTGTQCWSQFERYSLGNYRVAALSWVFKNSKIFWEWLIVASVRVILKKYSISSGHLVIDDTDRQRSKSTSHVANVHKIYDKKTGGYFMGQNLVFLLLVTDKITLPVGFKFFKPDPKRVAWNHKDEELRNAGVPKSQRPEPPAEDPAFPTKIALGLQLLSEFKKFFPDFTVPSINADAAYGSSGFFHECARIYPKTQVISQLRSNQKVIYRGKPMPVSDVFGEMKPIEIEISLRGNIEKVSLVAARLRVESHDQIQLIVALKYEGEEKFRYIVANDLSWRAEDVVKAYSSRWLVELIWKAWKSFLHLDEITSANRNIILNMTLVAMCAGLMSGAISISVVNDDSKIKQLGISVQRSISFLLRIGSYLFQNIRKRTRGSRKKLLEVIELFKSELIDPNFKNRVNTMGRVYVGLVFLE